MRDPVRAEHRARKSTAAQREGDGAPLDTALRTSARLPRAELDRMFGVGAAARSVLNPPAEPWRGVKRSLLDFVFPVSSRGLGHRGRR
jgi:hypothetical protein